MARPKTNITEDLIRYVTKRLDNPATEKENEILIREMAGRDYQGYRYQAHSLIVYALNTLRRNRELET